MSKQYGVLVRIWETENGARVNGHRELWGLDDMDDLKRLVKQFTDDGFVVELEGVGKNE